MRKWPQVSHLPGKSQFLWKWQFYSRWYITVQTSQISVLLSTHLYINGGSFDPAKIPAKRKYPIILAMQRAITLSPDGTNPVAVSPRDWQLQTEPRRAMVPFASPPQTKSYRGSGHRWEGSPDSPGMTWAWDPRAATRMRKERAAAETFIFPVGRQSCSEKWILSSQFPDSMACSYIYQRRRNRKSQGRGQNAVHWLINSEHAISIRQRLRM